MTTDMMSLRALLEKSSDVDSLREMIGFAAQRLMELEVGGLTGAGHGERSADRINHRNGYRDRDWETRAGTAFRASRWRHRSHRATPVAPSSPVAEGPRVRIPCGRAHDDAGCILENGSVRCHRALRRASRWTRFGQSAS